jgi:hypothetical protein
MTWRLAWLTFCLLIVCLAGTRTLKGIAPYVLAGIGDRPAANSRKAGRVRPVAESGLANWVLPTSAWSLIFVSVVKWLLFS